MILYRTKNFGLLSDRVYKAIQESKLDPRKLEKMEINTLFRHGKHIPLTSKKTKKLLSFEEKLENDRLDDLVKKAKERKRDNYFDIEKEQEKSLNNYISYQKKLNPSYKYYEDPEYKKLEEKFEKIRNQQEKFDRNKYNEINDRVFDTKFDLQVKYDDLRRKVKDEWFNNKPQFDIGDIEEWNYITDNTHFKSGLSNSVESALNSIKKATIKPTKNSDKIYNSIKSKQVPGTIIENDTSRNIGSSYYNPVDKKVHLEPGSEKNPYTVNHELEHFERDLFGLGIDRSTTGNGSWHLRTPGSVLNAKDYIEREEGSASRGGFIKTFLNKNSGGRDWKHAHLGFNDSMDSYYATLLMDKNKTGLLNQEYNFGNTPYSRNVVMKRFRENAKKLGIDLDKSAKIQYTKATPEEREAIEKYVKENEDKF